MEDLIKVKHATNAMDQKSRDCHFEKEYKNT